MILESPQEVSSAVQIEEMNLLLESVCQCMSMRDISDPQIPPLAFNLLNKIFVDPKLMDLICLATRSPQDMPTAFILITSNILSNLAPMLASEKDVRAEEVVPILKLIKSLILSCNDFFNKYSVSIRNASHLTLHSFVGLFIHPFY